MILSRKASVGMYSGCDKLSLQILFVYFLALPSLLHPLIFNCFLYLPRMRACAARGKAIGLSVVCRLSA